MKKQGVKLSKAYEDIEMPKNTGMGIYISGFAFLAGFALVWQIAWLTLAGIIGVIVCVIMRSFDEETEYVLTAAEIKRLEATHGS